MPKKYKITPLVWVVRDEASVKFHVKSDDYFGTIATVLSLLKQQIKKDGSKPAVLLKTFNILEKDLLFLQKNYLINSRAASKRRPQATAIRPQSSPKIRNKKIKPKGKLKSQ